MKTNLIKDINSLFKYFIDKLNSLDKDNLEEVNDFLDEYSIYFERRIFDSIEYENISGRDYLNNKIIELLNTNTDSLLIGDSIIKYCLTHDKRIDSFLYYYDLLRCLNELDITKDMDINIDFKIEDDSIIKDNITIHLGKRDLFNSDDVSNLLHIRKVLKKYDEDYHRDNKNDLENIYYQISYYLKRISLTNKLSDLIPNNYDQDLYSYKSLSELIRTYNDTRLDNVLEELNTYSRFRDVNSDDYFIMISGLNIEGIDEDLLANDYVERYLSNKVDNSSIEENGYDKANLLPFIYILIDLVSNGLKNDVLEDNWDNYKNLYEVIIRSQDLLKIFKDYNSLIKDNKKDDNDNTLVEFLKFKLYDIYNSNSEIVNEWCRQNYIDNYEYNSDYYKGDMKKELDTMYLRDYINRERIVKKVI